MAIYVFCAEKFKNLTNGVNMDYKNILVWYIQALKEHRSLGLVEFTDCLDSFLNGLGVELLSPETLLKLVECDVSEVNIIIETDYIVF